MAQVFALQRIQGDIMFRNDDYVAAEKVKAINRLLEYLRFQMRTQVCLAAPLRSRSTCKRTPLLPLHAAPCLTGRTVRTSGPEITLYMPLDDL